MRVSGGGGYRTVKSEIFIDCTLFTVDGRLNGVELIGDLFELGRRSTLGGKSGRFDLNPGAQLHDVEYLAQGRTLVEIDAEGSPHMTGYKSAYPLPRDHQSVSAQRCNRFSNNGTTDAGRGDHFLFGRQT